MSQAFARRIAARIISWAVGGRRCALLAFLFAAGVTPCAAVRGGDYDEDSNAALRIVESNTDLPKSVYEKGKSALERYRDKRAEKFAKFVAHMEQMEGDVSSDWRSAASDGMSALEALRREPVDQLGISDYCKKEQAAWQRLLEMRVPERRYQVVQIRKLTEEKTKILDELWKELVERDAGVDEAMKQCNDKEVALVNSVLGKLSRKLLTGGIKQFSPAVATIFDLAATMIKEAKTYRESVMPKQTAFYDAVTKMHNAAEEIDGKIKYDEVKGIQEFAKAELEGLPDTPDLKKLRERLIGGFDKHVSADKELYEKFYKANNGRFIGRISKEYYTLLTDPDARRKDRDNIDVLIREVDAKLEVQTAQVKDEMRDGPEKDEALRQLNDLRKRIREFTQELDDAQKMDTEAQKRNGFD